MLAGQFLVLRKSPLAFLKPRRYESNARDFQNILLEIVDARHKRGFIIFSSQFSPAGWHGKIDEDTLADAILD